MATKPMKTLKLPGLDDTYTFLQNDTTLAVSGKAADAKATGDALAAVQAHVDGVQAGQYPDMGAGQLLSTTGTVNPTPYTYRENTSGSDRVTISQITGGTVAFNQLVSFNAGTSSSKGITATANADGTVSFSGTATDDYTFYAITPRRENIQSHVIMLRGCPSGGSTTGYRIQDGYSSSSSMDTGSGKLYKTTSANGYSNAQVSIASGTTVENVVFKPQYFDLTQMFGSAVADYIYGLETATAGAGVALFRQMFPESYYPYNAGELVSVQTSGRKTVGVNLFDKSTATIGKFIHGNYTEQNNGQSSHSDYIRAIAGANYTASGFTQVANVWTFIWYDGDKNPIGRTGSNPATAPSGCKYVIVNFPTTAIATVQLNLGTTAVPYEPYSAHTYPLDSTLTLRGVPVLTDGVPAYNGDRYAPNGTVTRRFKTLVLNGTETWKKGTFAAHPNVLRAYMDLPDAVVGSVVLNDHGYDGYYTGQKLGIIRVVSNAGTPILDVYLDINVYADTAAWKAHLAESPMTIVYELATPTTETAAPYQEIQIAGSTEEFLPPETDTRAVAVPVGSQSLYQTNLRAGLETLLDTDPAHAESIAPVQGSTASTNIAEGELLMHDGKLYQATQAIVAGAEIGSTNTTETTLAAQLAALEARIAALEN